MPRFDDVVAAAAVIAEGALVAAVQEKVAALAVSVAGWWPDVGGLGVLVAEAWRAGR